MESLIFVTTVETKGSYLKIMGQIDKSVAILIESSLHENSSQFDQGKHMLSKSECQEGVLCCAKYKDGDYYRAQITNTTYLSQDVVELLFIDYGNRENCTVKDLRGMTCFAANIVTLPPLAREFIIAGYTHAGSKWNERAIEELSENIKYISYNYKVVGQIGNNVMITLLSDNNDPLAKYAKDGFISTVPLEIQQAALQESINKRTSNGPTKSPETIITYRSTPILVNEEYKAYISYVTDGPCLFTVQLREMEEKLDNLMRDINNPGMNLQRLDDFPIPGSVCLAQSLEDNYICRAVVTSTVDSRIKVFYVDFGNTEELQFSRLYQMPVKYLIPKVMATRFGLAGLSGCNVNMEMKVAFKDFVTNKVLTMRKVPQTAESALPLCELHDKNNVNALDFIKKAAVVSYSDPVSLVKGICQEVRVTYANNCRQFFVQLASKQYDIASLMKLIQRTCASKKPIDPRKIALGTPCIALNESDMTYYRAEIIGIEEKRVLCKFVDFGFQGHTIKSNVVPADPEIMMMLKPQAIECCLNGYYNIDKIDPVWDIFFRKIAEKSLFSLKLVETTGTKHLVDLFDEKNASVNTLIYDQLGTKTHHKNLESFDADNNILRNTQRSNSGMDNIQYSNGEENWREIRNRNDNSKNERNLNNHGLKQPTRQSDKDSTDRQKKRADNSRKTSREGSENSYSGSDISVNKYPKKSIKPLKQEFDFAGPNDAYEEYDDLTKMCLQKVSVCWFFNPANFYCQLYREQVRFSVMMKEIQFTYKSRNIFTEATVDMPVIAQFEDDGALYRAKIIQKIKSTMSVYFVDFGNISKTDIVYQIEKKHMEMPAQALHCSLPDIVPFENKAWPKTEKFSSYFNKDMYSCLFSEKKDKCYYVNLLLEEIDPKTSLNLTVKEKLIDDKLASDYIAPNKLKVSLLNNRTIRCKLHSMESLSNIELQLQPKVIVTCSFFFWKNATEDSEQILRNYINKFVIVHVNNIVNDKLSVIFYNELGNLIDLLVGKNNVPENISPVCPYPIIFTSIEGRIVNISGVSIFIKPVKHEETIDSIKQNMCTYYERISFEDIKLSVGKMVAFKSKDSNWYRGRVMKKISEQYRLHVIDYGRIEFVSLKDIRVLTMPFLIYHELVVQVHVKNCAGLEINDLVQLSSLHYKQDDLHGKLMVIQSTWKPFIVPPSKSIATLLVSEPEQKPETAIVEANTKPRTDSNKFQVELSHFDNPNEFYLQLIDSIDTINKLQIKLQQEAPGLPAVDNVTTGILCAAVYSVDQLWYRAQVLDADSDITTVRFIDYGNTDVLNNDSTTIKILPAEMLTLDQHARRCSLYLGPVNGEWSTAACERFDLLVADKDLEVNIVHEDEKSTYVDLYADGQNVGKTLYKENLATKLDFEATNTITGYFSHMNSPSEFWMQLESACGDLEWIADQLEHAENYKPLENSAPGTLCAAIFADDGNWYRARILSNTIAGIEVIFIDYGNSCTCTSLKELPEELVMLPALAQKCSLQKPPGILEWPIDATDRLNTISADGLAIFNVYKLSQGETSIVQLVLNGEDISLKLLPELKDVKLSHVISVDEFYVQEIREDMEKMQVELQKEAANYKDYVGDSKDDVVIAQCESTFFRCKKIDEKQAFLIDVGIVKDFSALKECPDKFNTTSIAPCAVKSKLQPLQDYTWNEESLIKFKEMIGTTFQAEFRKDSLIVRLYYKYSDIRSQLPAVKLSPNSVHTIPAKLIQQKTPSNDEKTIPSTQDSLQVNESNNESVVDLATEIKSELIEEVERKINEISIKDDAKNDATDVEHSIEVEESKTKEE
ncbi:PREDICTED: maternal protein tudor isoform X2 [Nicrophorus vespilloides]|uniref:Maternal protein tudor isoform X2 n=1 Tax=Nicrophorus vespilloides TaxID=110193 RepID=A0ABM1N8Q4_NICVS|nr:PREDICTED: maternal protein tudor isoform X2 [Nicrophorus vespilloides]